MEFKPPAKAEELINWKWSDFEPGYTALEKVALTPENVAGWLSAWSRVAECVDEMYSRLHIATTVNTIDKDAEEKFNNFLNTIFPNAMAWEQKLKVILLASGLEPEGFEIPLRNYRSDAGLFREENLPLLAEDHKYATEYDKIVGAQTVNWEGEEKTLAQLGRQLQSEDRSIRQRAWEMQMERIMQDRAAYNDLWVKMLKLRMEIAKNAGLDSYRDYKWRQYYRFDYTPENCREFHAAIEQVVVPAVQRQLERHRKLMGIDSVRPWDIDQKHYPDPLRRPPLTPYKTVDEQIAVTGAIFDRVDPVLGGYYRDMVASGLTDIPNRKNKGGGAFCSSLNVIRKPFVYCNSVGTHDDVQTLIHESGHAFHVYESAGLPYLPQLNYTMEIAEVASMAMELLASPYLERSKGGFYSEKDAARAVSQHLILALLFWPYMAVVDSFQHWVYENPQDALNPGNCDAEWGRQWDRFMKGYDWSGYEDYKKTGWHRKMHIFQVPFYYVEYGLAQLGAVEVWGNALKDQVKAVADYRKALSLGGMMPLPDLFNAAGVKFAFDAGTLGHAVGLIETRLDELAPLAFS